MAAFIPLYSGSWQRAQAWTTAALCRASRSRGHSLWRCLSKRGDFAAYTRCDLNCVAKFPLLRGEVALIGNPEARVSRLIGKFDTTASGPKRQVGFLVLPGHTTGNGGGSCGKVPHKCQSATPLWGGAPAFALVTGLSNKCGGSCPPSAFPRPGSASWRLLFTGFRVLSAANLCAWQPVTSLALC